LQKWFAEKYWAFFGFLATFLAKWPRFFSKVGRKMGKILGVFKQLLGVFWIFGQKPTFFIKKLKN
jgi:hypothetical protein